MKTIRKQTRRAIGALLVLLLMLATLSACTVRTVPSDATNLTGTTSSPAHTDGTTPASGLLFWEVTSPDGTETMYLLGSIHVADDSIYPMPEVVMNAYQSSDLLAVEADILAYEQDQEAISRLTMRFFYTDGTTIRDHLPADLYEQAKTRLTDAGLYAEAYDWVHPFLWNSLLDQIVTDASELDAEHGVDRHFLELAHQSGKRIFEIESVEEQYNVFLGFSDELWTALIGEMLATEPEAQMADLRDMYDLWKSGNVDAFTAYCETDMDGLSVEERALYEAYNDAVLTQRNLGMTQTALDLLQSGETCFLIVGAAHMVGETGLVESLQQFGYTVVQR